MATASTAKPTEHKKQGGKGHKSEGNFLSILLRIGIVLLLLIPTYIAIGNYIYEKNHAATVVESYYTSLELEGPQGVLQTLEATPDANDFSVLSCFRQMIEGGVSVPTVPTDSHSGLYHVAMHTNTDTVSRFSFYFSPDSRTAYYTDASGKHWQAPEEHSYAFLNSAYAFELYEQSTPPVLTTAATDVVIPTSLSWHYRTQDENNFSPLSHVETTAEERVYPIANDIVFYFSLTPSNYEVVIRRGGAEVHRGAADDISLPQLVKDELLDVEIRAFYNASSNIDYYGEATYRFRMLVVEAASFTPNSGPYTAGDLLLFTCHNVRNEQNLRITSPSALGGTPFVFKRDDLVYALVPVGKAGTLRLTVSYGTVSEVFDITVLPDLSVTAHTLTAASLRGNWQGMLGITLQGVVDRYGATADSGFPRGTLFLSPATAPAVRFGDTASIDGTPLSHSFRAEIYRTSGDVTAMAGGTVVRKGNDPLLGRFVILDHGCGLYTWYCGLAEIYPDVGRSVSAGQPIGLAGDGGVGFAGESGYTLLATLGTTLISPDYLRTHNLNIT